MIWGMSATCFLRTGHSNHTYFQKTHKGGNKARQGKQEKGELQVYLNLKP